MKHTILEAARLAGVSRSTIDRYMKKGKLSYDIDEDGTRFVDTSELARVFEKLKNPETFDRDANTVPMRRDEISTETVEMALLQQENRYLKAEVKELRADKEWYKEQMKKIALPAPEREQKSKSLSWVNAILIGCGVVTTGVLVFVAWVLPHLG